ncbi:hypothetical protein GCM10020220_000700 [Nonomuraea rubra]
MSADVLVLGGSGVDTTVYVPELPLPYRDTYHVPPVVDRIGNTGSGVALGCHALGLGVVFADLIGDDPQGALIRDALSGLDCRWGRAEAGTTRSVLLVGPDGRRLSLHDPKATPGERLPRELYTGVDAAHVHVSISDRCRDVHHDLEGRSVSTDLHDWDGVNDYHKDFAYRSDLVFLSAAALSDPAAAMRGILRHGRAHTVVCTRGADGCLVLTRDAARCARSPPPRCPARWPTATAPATRSSPASCTACCAAGRWRSPYGWAPSPARTPARSPAPTSPRSARRCCWPGLRRRPADAGRAPARPGRRTAARRSAGRRR